MRKTRSIFANSLPILVMIGLIPLVANDYLLSGLYALIIALSLLVHREPYEIRILIFGFCVMIVAEYIFVSTGVETFERRSLLGYMPAWLPLLWGYAFVAMKRAVLILSIGTSGA